MVQLNKLTRFRNYWLIIISLILVACGEYEEKALNVAGNKWLGYQPLFVAYEVAHAHHDPERKHSHEILLNRISHEYSVTILPSTSSVMRAMGNHQLDIAMLTLDEALQFQSQTGMPLCIPLVMDYSNGADALVVNPDTFRKLKDRKLTIGYESTALGGYMLRRATEVLNLPFSEIEPIIVEPNDQVRAYRKGRLDAVITFEPYLSTLRAAGAELIFSSQDIPDEIIDVMVVRQEVWDERKEQVRSLIDVLWQSGLDMVNGRDSQSISIISKITGLSDSEVISALNGMHLVGSVENERILKESLPGAIASMKLFMRENNMLSAEPNITACR